MIRSKLPLVPVALFAAIAPHLPAQEVTQEAEPAVELRRAPGTRVFFDVPPEFDLGSGFQGFQHVETSRSLMLSEIPGPLDEVRAGFTDPAGLESQGLERRSTEPLAQGEHRGWLYRFDQHTPQGAFGKWIWVFGHDEATLLVVGMWPLARDEEFGDPMRRIVTSADWRPDLELDPFEGIAYRITDPGEFRFAGSMSGALLFSPDGEMDEERTGKPLFLCAPGLRAVTGDPERFARTRIRATAGVKRVRPGEFEPLEVDGMPGFEATATAIDENDETPRFVYQALLLEGAAFWLMQGHGPAERREELLPAFRDMARSFRRRHETLETAAGLIRVTVPATWNLRQGLSADADLEAGHPVGEAYVIVIEESKRDLRENEVASTLDEYVTVSTEFLRSATGADGDPRTVEVDGRPARRLRFRSESEDADILYHVLMIESQTHYHQVLVWTLTEVHERVASDLERVIDSIDLVERDASEEEPAEPDGE